MADHQSTNFVIKISGIDGNSFSELHLTLFFFGYHDPTTNNRNDNYRPFFFLSPLTCSILLTTDENVPKSEHTHYRTSQLYAEVRSSILAEDNFIFYHLTD